MTNWTVNDFKETILKGQEIPNDLANIIQSPGCLAIAMEQLEFELIGAGHMEEVMACSYLSDEQKEEADIQANIFAIHKVFEYITFFAEAENGMLVGYWHDEERVDILKAPLVSYNTEGEFELLTGNQIIEALASHWTSEDEDEYEEIQDHFSQCDMQITSLDSLVQIKTTNDPTVMHDTFYREKLKELEKINK